MSHSFLTISDLGTKLRILHFKFIGVPCRGGGGIGVCKS